MQQLLFWVCCLVLSALSTKGQFNPMAIGSWKSYLPSVGAERMVLLNNQLYVVNNHQLYALDTTNGSAVYINKSNGLTDAGIQTLGMDSSTRALVIGYQNGNIDFWKPTTTKNLPALKMANNVANKSIQSIQSFGSSTYISSGNGVLVINPQKVEIQETWPMGSLGNPITVHELTLWNGRFWAATAEGLKRAIGTSNLQQPSNWQTIAGLPAGECRYVKVYRNQLLAVVNQTLFISNNGNDWRPWYVGPSDVIIEDVSVSENECFQSQRFTNGNTQVIWHQPNGTIRERYAQPNIISYPKQAFLWKGQTWIADKFAGVTAFSGPNQFVRFQQNGPLDIADGPFLFDGSTAWIATGTVNDIWNYQFNKNGIQRLRTDQWTNISGFILPDLANFLDVITLAKHPNGKEIWAGSYGGGLLRIDENDRRTLFKEGTALRPTIGDPGSYRVAGLAFDQQQQLWVSNFGSPIPLVVRKPDGSWVDININFNLREQALSQIIIDPFNRKWIVSPKGNGVLVYDDKGTLENLADDSWRLFKVGRGNGNLPDQEVRCLTLDNNGLLWVGTNKGIAVLACAQDPFSPSCEFVQPVVQQGNNTGFLFESEQVRTIAVDGANRKWIGSNNGVWLMDADMQKTIARFTELNSPLLANVVKQIAVEPNSGEVWMATAKGISVYRGNATMGGATNDQVIVYPNPVNAGYTGPIAIKGLVNNAWVKIIDPNGRLVFQTRAFGGQAIWNGTDYTGKRAASGIYVVMVADDSRKERAAAKIIFVY